MIEEFHQVTWIILKAVESIHTGRHKIAEFLKGSRSKDIANLRNEQGYGSLLWFDIETIMSFIKQLENMNLVARKPMPHLCQEIFLEDLKPAFNSIAWIFLIKLYFSCTD